MENILLPGTGDETSDPGWANLGIQSLLVTVGRGLWPKAVYQGKGTQIQDYWQEQTDSASGLGIVMM